MRKRRASHYASKHRPTRPDGDEREGDWPRSADYYLVLIRRVAVLGVCSAGESTNVSRTFQPSGRFWLSNSLYDVEVTLGRGVYGNDESELRPHTNHARLEAADPIVVRPRCELGIARDADWPPDRQAISYETTLSSLGGTAVGWRAQRLGLFSRSKPFL
jgi:hypothetical protein